jgi:hypothetical protein
MIRLIVIALTATASAMPLFAAHPQGSLAPAFTTQASFTGKAFTLAHHVHRPSGWRCATLTCRLQCPDHRNRIVENGAKQRTCGPSGSPAPLLPIP